MSTSDDPLSATRALAADPQQLTQFVRQAPFAIAMVDRDMKYLVHSDAWFAAYGRGRKSLIGVSHYEVHPDLPERWKAIHQRGLAGEYQSAEQDHWVLPNGADLWLRWVVAPWRRDDRSVGGIVMYASAITEPKEADAVRQRASALEAEVLNLREIDRLKTAFLSNMSHEMRTPLHAILGFAQLQQVPETLADAERYREYARHIESSGRHLLSLIDAVLDFTSIEAGRISLQPASVRLADQLRQTIEMLDAPIRQKSVRIETQLTLQPDELVLDPLRLRQVMLNYLSNAIKFSNEAGRVLVRAFPEGPQHFRLEVVDEGVGIAESDTPRLFVAFQQVGAQPNRQQDGIGLGLAIVRRIVEAQGGTVGVRSVLGQGSVFHAVLPRRHDDQMSTTTLPTS